MSPLTDARESRAYWMECAREARNANRPLLRSRCVMEARRANRRILDILRAYRTRTYL